MVDDSKVIRQGYIECDLSLYEGFFNHDWAVCTRNLAHENEALRTAFAELGLAWKSVSNAFRQPWLLANAHTEFIRNFLADNDPLLELFIKKLRNGIAARARISGQGEGLLTASDVIEEVRKAVVADWKTDRAEHLSRATAESAWLEYLQISEFQLSVIGLMSMTFVGLLFAYECFLLRCYQILTSDTKTRTTARTFKDKFHTAVGQTVAEQCWTGDSMLRNRKVRNCLAHNGGKYNDDLNQWKDSMHIIDDVLQISATDNRRLYSELETNVDHLIVAVLESPESTCDTN